MADPFPFTTAGEFANFCDGGPDALLEARTNEELNEKLTARAVPVVVWLKHHSEYAGQSYGDGIWAALKGVYCP